MSKSTRYVECPVCHVVLRHIPDDAPPGPFRVLETCDKCKVMTPERAQELVAAGTYEATKVFCPFCGKQPVIVEPGEGDYYVGPEYRCGSCNETFYLR